MNLELPKVKRGYEELEPVVSRRALAIHHREHDQAYLNNARKLASERPLEDTQLEAIVRRSMREMTRPVPANKVARAWNYLFFWQPMSPFPSKPAGEFAQQAESDFGGLEQLTQELEKHALGLNGWVWLVMENHYLPVVSTANAALPYCYGQTPLLALDIWEHAHCLNHLNRRRDYVDRLVGEFVDWRFAGRNFEKCKEDVPCAVH